jgi:hypothetical protein
MTETNITAPSELVKQWTEPSGYKVTPGWLNEVIQKAIQYGADQELKACCEWLRKEVNGGWGLDNQLTATRRPKLLNLKKQALAVLEEEPEDSKELIVFDTDQVNIIRRALEQLDD